MWDGLFIRALRRGIGTGQLTVTFPDGRRMTFGPGGQPAVAAHIRDPDLTRRILLNPELALGEAYTDGTMTIEGDDLIGFLQLIMRFRTGAGWSVLDLLMKLNKARNWLADLNPARKARANVAHHYDLTGEIYDAFLDRNKQYTCAYFREPGMTLDEAQLAKMQHIGRKLLLRPGMRVLDIGCGFGTFAVYLAREFGARVTGITLSEVQLAEARARANAAGVTDLVDFRLQDYRSVGGQFDRVVSVGMMEHVGRPHLTTYFRKVRDLLTPNGVALIHYIGRPVAPMRISPWFQKYIFPGAYCPSLSQVLPILEREQVALCDLEVWRGHYDPTLAAWRANFDAHAERVLALTDARFIRMWRYYLASAEVSFSEGLLTIHQLQLARSQSAVPASRDYLYAPSGTARQGSNTGARDFPQAQRAHQVGEGVDLLRSARHLEDETFQR